MDELTGGGACPRCGFVFEPGEICQSTYNCTGKIGMTDVKATIAAYSKEEAVFQFVSLYQYMGHVTETTCNSAGSFEYDEYA